jgi:hypothetical protein
VGRQPQRHFLVMWGGRVAASQLNEDGTKGRPDGDNSDVDAMTMTGGDVGSTTQHGDCVPNVYLARPWASRGLEKYDDQGPRRHGVDVIAPTGLVSSRRGPFNLAKMHACEQAGKWARRRCLPHMGRPSSSLH